VYQQVSDGNPGEAPVTNGRTPERERTLLAILGQASLEKPTGLGLKRDVELHGVGSADLFQDTPIAVGGGKCPTK